MAFNLIEHAAIETAPFTVYPKLPMEPNSVSCHRRSFVVSILSLRFGAESSVFFPWVGIKLPGEEHGHGFGRFDTGIYRQGTVGIKQTS